MIVTGKQKKNTMRAEIEQLNLRIPVQGKGDLSSSLRFKNNWGWISLDSEGWNLSGFENLEVSEGMLKTPSGNLSFWSNPPVFPSIVGAYIFLPFHQGIWEGALSSLVDGKTSFGYFSLNKQKTLVTRGIYLLPSEEESFKPASLSKYIGRQEKISALEAKYKIPATYYLDGGPLAEKAFQAWQKAGTRSLISQGCKACKKRPEVEELPMKSSDETFLLWWWATIARIDMEN